MFTLTDKTLMMRAARLVAEQAAALKKQFPEGWGVSKESKTAKREYDRLTRDERDLRALAKRLEKAAGPVPLLIGQAPSSLPGGDQVGSNINV